MPHFESSRAALRGRQRGVALVVTLVFLLLLTILSTSALRDTTLQERMAGNLRDSNLALQAAEAALRAGESWVLSAAGGAAAAALDSTLESAADWDGEDPEPAQPALEGFSDEALHAADPVYHVSPPRTLRMLEGSVDIGSGAPTVMTAHEVTARGVGGRATSIAVLQTTVLRP
jgi:type IV pilus assembly protein PilX